MTDRICSVEGCDRGGKIRRGWCSRHYTNWYRHGEVEPRKRGEVRDGKKICAGCGDDLPLNQYGIRSIGDAVRARCHPCELIATKARFSAAPDVIRGYSLTWQKRWPDKASDRQARRRARRTTQTIDDVRRLEVFERDNWCCTLCGEPIDSDILWPKPLSPSLDHRIPLALGGDHSMANCAAAHLVCNMRKGANMT